MPEKTNCDKKMETEAVQCEQEGIAVNHLGPQRPPALEKILVFFMSMRFLMHLLYALLANLDEFYFLRF